MLLSWCLAIPIGIYSAVHPYSRMDKMFSFCAFFGMSVPGFFLAFLLLYVASVTGWFPIGGLQSINYDTLSLFEKVWDRVHHLMIPTLVLGTGSMAGLVRLMRGNMLETLRAEFVTTARAKGLAEQVVIYKHALRNAINPFITIFGYQLSTLFSGAAITEIITAWPGLGRLMLDAVISQDLFLVMGNLLMGSVLLIVGNLSADILLAVSDPRIRHE
jgi:peptide/nickel transport system permease protein